MLGLQKTLELLNADLSIAEDALEEFRVPDFGRVKWNRNALAGKIPVNHVTSTLPRQ